VEIETSLAGEAAFYYPSQRKSCLSVRADDCDIAGACGFIKHTGQYDATFMLMGGFIFAFFGSFVFYLYSQKDIYEDWRRRIYLFPVFMAGSMGLSVNNTKAVIEGLLNRKSEFVRTPKYGFTGRSGSWADKKYTPRK